MSDLTGNWFYLSAEGIWLCKSKRLNNALISGPAIDLGGYVIFTFGAQKTRAHIFKSQRTQNESMSKKWPLQSMVIVIGLC